MDTRFVVNRDEFHSLQSEVKHHAERLSRLERRQQDDAALKSVWNSPFPSVLAGTPQQEPVDPSNPNDYFDLDEHGDHLLGSLTLDPSDDEPIRRGAASRANSVRFAESAFHPASWNTQPRAPSEFNLSRPGSGLMMERTLSHKSDAKSDGRHSSTGHSIYSGVSGRASSLGMGPDDEDDDDEDIDVPVPPPSLFIMGSVPSIIRCWLTPRFSHESLLYADICTGSQKSTLDFSLAKELDLHHTLERDIHGNYTLTMPVYLAEAIITQPHSRHATNLHQIPSIMVTFEVTGLDNTGQSDSVGLKIFIGSDALRANSADVLLSQNKVVLYSKERDKLAVPFVRPEDEAVFKNITTVHLSRVKPLVRLDATATPFVYGGDSKVSSQAASRSVSKGPESRTVTKTPEPPRTTPTPTSTTKSSTAEDSWHDPSSSKSTTLTTPSNTSIRSEQSEPDKSSMPPITPTSAVDKRRESNAGIWGSWRNGPVSERDGLSGYQPAGKGGRTMKILKPSRPAAGRKESLGTITTSKKIDEKEKDKEGKVVDKEKDPKEGKSRSSSTAGPPTGLAFSWMSGSVSGKGKMGGD